MQPQPHTSYLVCGTPRCGSSLLCEALKNTGVAGRPEEYFWRGDESFWRERWVVSTYEEYLTRAIEQGTTSNGMFGERKLRKQADTLSEEWVQQYHYLKRIQQGS